MANAVERHYAVLSDAIGAHNGARPEEQGGHGISRLSRLRCVLATTLYELGRENDCRESFDGLAADDFGELPRDEEWLFGVTLLAPVCAALGDTRRAGVLYELLAPYEDRIALSIPDVSTGSVSRSLGILAAAVERWDQATHHLEHALATNSRIGARPWVARTRQDYAHMLLARDAPGDREKAQECLALAIETYRQLGMEACAESAAAVSLD